MSAVNPSEPDQPSQNTAYNVAGNPASKEPAEQSEASKSGNPNDATK